MQSMQLIFQGGRMLIDSHLSVSSFISIKYTLLKEYDVNIGWSSEELLFVMCYLVNSGVNLLMSLKKSEEFLYFQDKARHYANLRNAKPIIKTRYHSFTLSTSEQAHQPYFKRYDLERENQGLINRITSIMTGPRLQIEQQGYTRYNRTFVPKSHYRIEQRKADDSITHENKHVAKKVLRAKPSVGTVEGWNKDFDAQRQIRSNISKYTESRNSKATLQVYASNAFMPEHYRSFLHRSARKASEDPSPEHAGKHVRIQAEALFQLPKLRKLRGSLTRIGENGQEVDYF